ncbi:MAG: hypothetical protein M1351_02135 [Candidatus Thermoplasmatota archaeon]|nr:hypothetical protein [Candidatus Thermoplasmatota archaeon]
MYAVTFRTKAQKFAKSSVLTTIPKPIAEHYNIKKGHALSWRISKDGTVELYPVGVDKIAIKFE